MRGLSNLIPEAQKMAEKLLKAAKKQGYDILITDTLRTKAEQDALYAQGRSTAGTVVTNAPYPQSAHNWGIAFDFCRNAKGREYDDSDGFFTKVGRIGESIGLIWGGNWTFADKPHFQLFNYSASNLIKKYSNPETFIKERTESDMTDSDFLQKLEEYLPVAFANMCADLAALDEGELWAKKALTFCDENGIVRGDSDGNLMPFKPVLRREVFEMFKNYHERFGKKDD